MYLLNLTIQNECYKGTRQCCNILTLVPVCTIVLRCDKDINYCRFMACFIARVTLLITITIPGSSGASRSIDCDLLFYGKSLINCSKTEGMWIGCKRHYKEKPFGIKWPDEPIKALGVYFTYDQKLLKENIFY